MERISLKKNFDRQIVISNKEDVETILHILKDAKSISESGEMDTLIRVEKIINVDFISRDHVISRLFLCEDKGKYFIEQPYNGVYTIFKENYDLIENFLKGN